MSLSNANIVRVSVSDISRRFMPALKKFIIDYGYEGIAKQLYGIYVEQLPWREDWWNYLDIRTTINQKLYEEAIRYGLPPYAAKKIATWKIHNVNDIVKLVRELRLMIRDDRYFEKALTFIAEKYNIRPEILKTLIDANNIKEYEEDLVSNDGRRIRRKYIVVDGREFIINNR